MGTESDREAASPCRDSIWKITTRICSQGNGSRATSVTRADDVTHSLNIQSLTGLPLSAVGARVRERTNSGPCLEGA